MAADGAQPFSTAWTGAAGDGDWDNADNWTNGVPQSGATFAASSDDVAMINEDYTGDPVSVVISGSADGAGELDVDSDDPGGPAVTLTGTLNFQVNVAPDGGSGFGALNLIRGTFEIDGGRLDFATINLQGGTLQIGSFAAYGAANLSDSILDGAFTLGNDQHIAIDQGQFFCLESDNGQNVFTIGDGGELDLNNSGLYLGQTIDLQSGGVLALQGGIYVWTGQAQILLDGGAVVFTGDETFGTNLDVQGDLVFADGGTLNVASGDATTIEALGGGSGGSLTIAADGGGDASTLEVDGTLELTQGGLSLQGSRLVVSGGAIDDGDIEGDAGSTAAFQGDTTMSNVTLDVAGGVLLGTADSPGSGRLNIQNTVTLGSDAAATMALSLNGGILHVESGATLNLDNVDVSDGVIEVDEGGTLVTDGQTTLGADVKIVDAPQATTWTGAAGDGDWNDAGNWTNGVPVSGQYFSQGGTDTATIDDSYETGPFTVVIDNPAGDGQAAVQTLVIDSANATVDLTGVLDSEYNSFSGGANFGEIDIEAGSLVLDGARVRISSVNIEGGALEFQNTTGQPSVLDASFVNGDFTIDNDATLQVAPYDFAGFGGLNGEASTVTVAAGATLDVQGNLSDRGVLQVQGDLLFDGGSFSGDSEFGGDIVVSGGGEIVSDGDFTLSGDTTIDTDAGFSLTGGHTTTVDSQAAVSVTAAGSATDIFVSDGSTLAIAGSLTLDAGLDNSGGSVVLQGGAIHGGTLTGSDGITVASSSTVDGVTLDTGLQLQATEEAAAVRSFATSSGPSAPSGVVLTVDGTTNFGVEDGNAPIEVDLNGGELDVVGTLNLANVNIVNGYIVVEQGGQLVQGDDVSLNQVQVTQVGPATTVLSGQDVDLTYPVTVSSSQTLAVNTGVQADGSTPTGAPGTFTVDYGGSITGSGVVAVTDANGDSSTVINGTVEAQGGALQLRTANWTNYGQLKADAGATLEVGDLSVTDTTALANGYLQNGSYEADAGATLQLDGQAAITNLSGLVTLDGAGSELVSGASGAQQTLEQSLTSIGFPDPNPNNYFDDFGTLRLYDGRGFSADNALQLYGSIGLQGGVLSAPSITGNFVYSYYSGEYSSIAGFGEVDAALSGNLYIEATDYQTLTLTGSLSGLYANYKADPYATLDIQQDLGPSASLSVAQNGLVQVEGALAQFTYISFVGTSGEVSLAHSATQTITVDGANDGDVIDLKDVALAPGGATIARPAYGPATLTANLAAGGQEVFTLEDFANNLTVSYQADGSGGSEIAFAAPASPVVQVNTTQPIDLGQVRVGASASAALSVTNTASTAVTVSLDASSSYGATASGGPVTLEAGATDAADFRVGEAPTYEGEQYATVLLDASASDPSGAFTSYAPQSVQVQVEAFRPGAAQVSAPASAIVHVGDPGAGALTIANTDYADGYAEGVVATVTGASGVTASGATGDVAAGATDASSITYSFDTSTAGVKTGSITLGLTTDGDGVDSLGSASEGSTTADVSLTVNAYAQALVEQFGGSGTLTADPNNPNGYILDLGSVVQGGGGLTANLGVLNAATGQADLLEGTFDPAAGDTTAFSSGFNGFSNVSAQNAAGESVTLNTTDVGTFTETVTLHPTGYNGSGYSGALTPQTITIVGRVTPKPPPPPAPGPVGVAWGDVHYVTFDNLHYDFQAEGEFTLAKSTVSGDSFDVQVRNLPAYTGSTVSTTQEVGAELGGGHRITFGLRQNTVWIDGSAALSLSTTNPLTVGDATITELSAASFKVTWATGETLNVVNNGTYFNTTVQLQDDAPAGSVQGLLGGYTGAANDFQLADGTVIQQPISQADLYGAFADAWRLTQGASLLDYASGQTTDTFTDKTFPADQISLSNLPTALVQAALDRVHAAGITDPNLAAAAALDFLVTGNPNAITGSQNVAQTVSGTQQANVGATVLTSPAVGVTAQAQSLVESASGDTTVGFGVYMTSAATTDTVLHWSIVTPQSGDLASSAFGSDPVSGEVTIAAGQTTGAFTVTLPAGALGIAPSEALVVELSAPAGTPVFAPTAQTQVVNASPEPGVAPTPLVGLLSGPGSLTRDGANYVLNLGAVVQGEDLGALRFATLVGFSGGADTFSDTLAGLDGDSIKGFSAAGDKIDATDLAYAAGATPSFVEDASGTFGTLTIGSGPNAASVTLFGQFSAAGFSEASDGHGGTMISYSAAQTQPQGMNMAHAIAIPAAV